ncbi:GNAT family N-acetyltransferase [Pseudarthrobacter oxydans]|uniref:GNAT family N-acetyltransferase n=1 Tax=Pseudarthrobacter oxydans TaxID=1671 RepID=UPI003813BC28
MKDLQAVCSPISVRSVRENVSTIIERLVLIAEVDGLHVGFCVSSPGLQDSDPMFFQVVAVAPHAQRRGVGLALLTAAAEREPRRDIALATQNDNVEARSLNEKFAKSIGASIRRVSLSTYRDCDFGIQRGLGYRAWVIQRLAVES